MISVNGLSFSYDNADRKSLDDINLKIHAGEFVVISGPSGCGKSTLALAMGGYIPHVFEGTIEGSVAVDGRLTTDAELAELASLIGIVQQDPEAQLCTLSVEDEVAFGPENLCLAADEVRARIEESLAMVGASYLKGRQVLELSGGEKQRVAIASMLAMRPKALILDEPTSNLDPTGASGVLAAIERLKKTTGMTIVVIEHRLGRLIELADRMIVMNAGRIVADGAPAEIKGRYGDHFRAKNSPAFAVEGGKSTVDPVVDVDGLRASYDKKEALHGIDFKAYPAEIIGIIGPNGSGKTTFLNVLMGLRPYDSGRLSILGMDLARVKTSDLARRCGFVFQNPNHQIFARTVSDEAAFTCRNFEFEEDDIRASVDQVLDKYGLTAYAGKHPLGISFGEKRRLNLCSVLPHGPALVLLDEPFIGQDPANVACICSHILQLKSEGKTVILVSHDMEMVYEYCDRVALFKDGRLLVDCPPANALDMVKNLGLSDYIPAGSREMRSN